MMKYEVIKSVVTNEIYNVEAKNWKEAKSVVETGKAKPTKTVEMKTKIKSVKRTDKQKKEKVKSKESVKAKEAVKK